MCRYFGSPGASCKGYVRDCKSEEKEKTLFEEWLGNITHYPRCITTVESNILV